MDEETIINAYEILHNARAALYTATENGLMMKRDYETAKADGLLSGSITGKNELERDAVARKTYIVPFFAMLDAERMERNARYEFDCALARVEMTRALLRLAELEARPAYIGANITLPADWRSA